MYLAGVYDNKNYTPYIVENDIRAEEVRKILTSFSKQSFAKVYGNNIFIIVDGTVLYKTTLKVPVDNSLLPLYIDTEMLLKLELPDNVLINCPWVEQNIEYILCNINLGNIVAKQDNLREDMEFESLLSLKSDQGMKFYKVNGFEMNKVYMIPVFTGFPNLNKQDTVDIELYNDAYRPGNVLVKYNIFKKKLNRNIEMIFKILDLH